MVDFNPFPPPPETNAVKMVDLIHESQVTNVGYRDNALVKHTPTYGLIRVKKEKIHKCRPPGMFIQFYYWLTFRTIRHHSVWRCKCNKVFKLTNHYVWVSTYPSDWIEQGGIE